MELLLVFVLNMAISNRVICFIKQCYYSETTDTFHKSLSRMAHLAPPPPYDFETYVRMVEHLPLVCVGAGDIIIMNMHGSRGKRSNQTRYCKHTCFFTIDPIKKADLDSTLLYVQELVIHFI